MLTNQVNYMKGCVPGVLRPAVNPNSETYACAFF
jgi:hypothetical protein